MASDSSKKLHRPGEQVPTTGIYRVLHRAHREPHEVVLRRDEVFPSCHNCGLDVRFELVRAAEEPARAQTEGVQ